MEKKRKILIATAFPTHGAGSGALVTTQAKSYAEAGHDVVIITGNNRTNFDKLEGVKYHIVPFTAETENPEKIEGQAPFNYLMFTTHTESTANFWNIQLKELEQYCDLFRKALKEEVKNFNPDVIHAQHNWLLSSMATEMGKTVVTTIHGTDLMGYEKSKIKLNEINRKIEKMKKEAENAESEVKLSEIGLVEEVYRKANKSNDIIREIQALLKSNKISMSKASLMRLMNAYDEQKKYKFYMSEAEKSAKNSEKIIVISDAQKEKFGKLFPYAADKVVLLENGYDPKIFYQDNNVDKNIISELISDNSKDGKISTNYDGLILFVGKFADFKGIDSMLTAAKKYEEQLTAQGKNPLTIVVGSGALEKKLKSQAAELGLKNTHFVGRQSHDVIRKLQNLADVSLIPSRNEPFGLVVIEGTACGHPVIGSNSGGIPGILNTTKKQLVSDEKIIKTPLGILVKPLPERPESLQDTQLDELDGFATSFVVSDNSKRKEILEVAKSKLNIDSNVLNKYFSAYTESTDALSEAVVKIVGKEITFDNNAIAEYTKNNYSQEIIRNKLFGIFDEAQKLNKNKGEEQIVL